MAVTRLLVLALCVVVCCGDMLRAHAASADSGATADGATTDVSGGPRDTPFVHRSHGPGADLLEWIAANGGEVGPVAVAWLAARGVSSVDGQRDADGGGDGLIDATGPASTSRGMVATADVPAVDSVLLKVPLDLLMTTATGKRTNIGLVLSYLDHSPTNALALQLLHAARFSSHPDFAPRDTVADPSPTDTSVAHWDAYVASLPPRWAMCSPLWYNETEARALEGTTLWRMSVRRRGAARRAYEHLFKERLFRFEAQAFPRDAPSLQFDAWLWALGMVRGHLSPTLLRGLCARCDVLRASGRWVGGGVAVCTAVVGASCVSNHRRLSTGVVSLSHRRVQR